MTTSSDSCHGAADENHTQQDHTKTDATAAPVTEADTATATIAADTAELPSEDIDSLSASIQSYSEVGGKKQREDSKADTTDEKDKAEASKTTAAPEDTVTLVSAADDSVYWDPPSMAPLNPRSATAIARLRAFRSPAFATWDRLPLSRRAAVLLLLYADRRGDLRVVLTMRAASLRNYSGHAAFPGGKADTLDETAYQIARREAWEEIGLPLDDAHLPRPFWIEHLCNLPYNLAKTELVVRPCVAFLHTEEKGKVEDTASSTSTDVQPTSPKESSDMTPDEVLIPRLDAKEVAAVFSAPFHNFLMEQDEVDPADRVPLSLVNVQPKAQGPLFRPRLPPGPWYEGTWTEYHGVPWKMHFFYVPVAGQRVAKPRKRERQDIEEASDSKRLAASNGDSAAAPKHPVQETATASIRGNDYDEIEETPGRYKVWGMTARILVDAAKEAYGEDPEFEHTTHFGDESTIKRLEKIGRFTDKKPKVEQQAVAEETKAAAKM